MQADRNAVKNIAELIISCARCTDKRQRYVFQCSTAINRLCIHGFHAIWNCQPPERGQFVKCARRNALDGNTIKCLRDDGRLHIQISPPGEQLSIFVRNIGVELECIAILLGICKTAISIRNLERLPTATVVGMRQTGTTTESRLANLSDACG